MILYGSAISSHARRVRMFCEEAGLTYTYREVDLMNGEQQRDEFLELNPNGKVPVIDDDGFVLNESHTILRYLADKHGLDVWYPRDLKARARANAWLDWVHTRLGVEVGQVFLHSLILGDRRDPNKVLVAKGWLEQIFAVMNRTLQAQACLCGNEMTLPDLAALTALSDLDQTGYDLSPYGSVLRYYEELKKLPSFSRTYCQVTPPSVA